MIEEDHVTMLSKHAVVYMSSWCLNAGGAQQTFCNPCVPSHLLCGSMPGFLPSCHRGISKESLHFVGGITNNWHQLQVQLTVAFLPHVPCVARLFPVFSCFPRVCSLVCVCLCGRGFLPPGTWEVSPPVDNHLISHRIRTQALRSLVARLFCLPERWSALRSCWTPLFEFFFFVLRFPSMCIFLASLQSDSPTLLSATIKPSSAPHTK